MASASRKVNVFGKGKGKSSFEQAADEDSRDNRDFVIDFCPIFSNSTFSWYNSCNILSLSLFLMRFSNNSHFL